MKTQYYQIDNLEVDWRKPKERKEAALLIYATFTSAVPHSISRLQPTGKRLISLIFANPPVRDDTSHLLFLHSNLKIWFSLARSSPSSRPPTTTRSGLIKALTWSWWVLSSTPTSCSTPPPSPRRSGWLSASASGWWKPRPSGSWARTSSSHGWIWRHTSGAMTGTGTVSEDTIANIDLGKKKYWYWSERNTKCRWHYKLSILLHTEPMLSLNKLTK